LFAPAWIDFQNSCVVPFGITAMRRCPAGDPDEEDEGEDDDGDDDDSLPTAGSHQRTRQHGDDATERSLHGR
jgi:hypothetical protein